MIPDDFFIVFPFKLKTAQFMSGAFLIIVGGVFRYYGRTEIFICRNRILIAFSSSMLSAWILSAVFSLLNDLLISELML